MRYIKNVGRYFSLFVVVLLVYIYFEIIDSLSIP